MQTQYLFLHVPVMPLNYDFSKIGHYHQFNNKKAETKAIKLLIQKLEGLAEDNSLSYKLAISNYAYSFLPSHLQKEMDIIVDWRFKKNIVKKDNGLRDSNFEIETIKDWEDRLYDWFLLDFNTNSIKKINIDFWFMKPNELQLEVLDILSSFRSLNLAHQNLIHQLEWFQNAEHILWMSKKFENSIYPSPFRNTYDAYINIMNMLSDFRGLIGC